MIKEFVSTDADAILERMIASYEQLTGRTLQPADPDRLMLSCVANIIAQERVYQNYCASQNIPNYAEGENLDELGQWIFGIERKGPQAAKCVVRFTLTAAQSSAVAIPSGTRVTDTRRALLWATTQDAAIDAGSTYTDIMVECETAGEIGNGYAAGQINTLVDVDNVQFFASCANITASDGGSDTETDDEYREQMRRRMNAFSTAGAEAAYVYWAKSVSDDIADVKAIRPLTYVNVQETPLYVALDGVSSGRAPKYGFAGGEQVEVDSITVAGALDGMSQLLEKGTDYTVEYADDLIKVTILPTGAGADLDSIRIMFQQHRRCHVSIYALMNDGTIASGTIKALIAAACNAENVRPLTDEVSVEDPAEVTYNINLTYYVSRDTDENLSTIQAAVGEAVNKYVKWQSAKLGRDINPSKLYSFLMEAGVKRITLTSPAYVSLNDGLNGDTPQVAKIGTKNAVFGGYENE